MRNLLILAAAFGLTTAANAQNTATTDQTGDGNDADITQTGSNQAFVSQTAGLTRGGAPTGGHTATITQVGAGNLVDFDQTFGTNSLGPKGSHTATLSQNGDGNRISGVADMSEASGFQSASQDSRSNLTAVVTQDGDRNVAEFRNGNPLDINQDGDDNFTRSNGGSDVDIDQIGDFNDAFNLGADATIYQEGDRNEARVAGGFAGSRHTADINQFGSDNVATASGDPRGGSTTVDQDGDFNSATMDYGNPGAKDAQGVDYSVTQDAGAFGAMGASNSFDATVRGTDNTATVSQTLTGTGMNSIVLQQLSDGNTATLTQTGVGNTATVTQQ